MVGVIHIGWSGRPNVGSRYEEAWGVRLGSEAGKRDNAREKITANLEAYPSSLASI